MDAFKRNTTQFMDWFQTQYYTLWERTKIPLILVLPTINEHLLSMLQNKVKFVRPATIITPEIYETFPLNLSLAAQVYFSYETLGKITKAIAGRKAVLTGGPFSDSIYEQLISNFLNVPILRSIRKYSVFE